MEFVRFLIAGGSCFLLELGILFVLVEYFSIDYLLAAGIAFSVSVIVNYLMCVKFVFIGNKNDSSRTKFLFIATSIFGLGINQFCMWLFVEKFFLHYMISKIAATGIVTMWNFFTKRLVLKQSKEDYFSSKP